MGIFIHRHLPKSYSDLAAFGFFLFAIHGIGFYELLVVLPTTSQPHSQSSGAFLGYYIHVIFGVTFYINAIVSLYKVITANTSVKGKVLPAVLKEGWRFCVVCECNAPPRSYHCHTCNTCILKRDHHCTFTGYCVGHTNQRYYVSLLINCAFAAAYSCFLNMDYFYHLFGVVSWKTILTIAFPMISWIFIENENVTGAQTFMTSLCLVGMFLNSGLIAYHVINIYNGQIVHEKTFGITKYDLGWKENFRQALGSRWKIAWISPLISSPQPSDGTEFLTTNNFESLKGL